MGSSISRREWLRAAAGVAAGAAACAGPAAAPGELPRRRPNVLLIAVDDLIPSLGCYGHPVVKSPNIDRLARRGIRFDRAYCQFPVCNPSRSSLLTGLYPETTGVLDNRVPLLVRKPDAVTMPRWFRDHGYETARIGKIFHDGQPFDDPKAWDQVSDPRGTPAGRKGEGRNLTGGEVAWCRWLAAAGTDDDQPDGGIAAEAIRFLEREREKPFFLGVGFRKPHDPFIAPKKYFDLYPLDSLVPPRMPSDRSPHLPLAIASAWQKVFDRFTDRERKEFMRAYYAGISFMDAMLGRVLDALDRRNLAGDTIVVFFGDHGYHLGTHGWWNKNTLFEDSCRAPLIIAAPGTTAPEDAGKACAGIAEFVDFFPTLADLCGLPAPQALHGASIRHLLADPGRPGKPAAFTVVHRGSCLGRSVRTDRWRYTEWDGGAKGSELYDHATDPGEYHNVVQDPRHAVVVAELKARLHAVGRPPAARS
ncbi:MAG: sulfatase [Planctomycetes bacterium]|nr:sulfatase [Planctomycetota bacterium]